MATSKRCAKLVSLIFILKNAIYLFITTEIVELFLYIMKSSGMAIKMSTSKPFHYVVSQQYMREFCANATGISFGHMDLISLRSKHFRASSARKLGREQKKGMTGEGEGREGNACPQNPRF